MKKKSLFIIFIFNYYNEIKSLASIKNFAVNNHPILIGGKSGMRNFAIIFLLGETINLFVSKEATIVKRLKENIIPITILALIGGYIRGYKKYEQESLKLLEHLSDNNFYLPINNPPPIKKINPKNFYLFIPHI